jgi:hypothetical protein
LEKKLETTRSVLTRYTKGWKTCDCTVQDVKDQLLALPRKSFRRLPQETGTPYSMCQGAAKKAKLHPYHVSVVQELLPMDLEKLVRYSLWFQHLVGEHPGILDVMWFTYEAWFHPSGYINSQIRVYGQKKTHMKRIWSLYIRRKLGCGVACPIDELSVPYFSIKLLPRRCI